MNSKPMPMRTQKIMHNDEQHIFVKLAHNEAWLCKAVTGSASPGRTSISRTTLVSDIIDRIKDAANGAETACAADTTDPMNDIDGCLPPPRAAKKSRINKVKKQCIELEFPSICPELCPRGAEMRRILLYVVDRMQVWISLNDVAWAVEYMHGQNKLKGVAAVPSEDTGPVGAAPTYTPQTEFAETLDASAEVAGAPSAVAEEGDTN